MKKVFISTGESSGELYGALLTRSLRKRWAGIRITGVGGEMMRMEGVELISEISGSFGLVEVVSKLKKLKQTFDRVVRFIISERPDVVVLIDFPDFNIRVAKAIKHTGSRILYYVSPQVWAWRKKRVDIIAEISDYVAVILPFEEAYYKDHEVQCEFVGHPIMEETISVKGSRENIREELGLKTELPILALLPGSRDSEVKRLLPVTIEIVRLFRKDYPDYQFVMPIAHGIHKDRYSDYYEELEGMHVKLIDGKAREVLSSSDIAVIASGTAAFQAALLEVPHVVIYKLFPLSYFIAKLVVNVQYINLTNIMLNDEVVKELLQRNVNSENILSEVNKIVRDDNYRTNMIEKFRKVRSLFKDRHASERVSGIIGELMGWD